MDNSMHDKFLAAYDEFADPLFRYCYLRLWDRGRAKDIMHETFTRTWGYLVDGGRIDNIKAFLYRTATNLVIDHVRRRKETSLDELQEEGFDPGHDEGGMHEIQFDAKKARNVLDKIDPAYRDVILMRYIEELSPKEIAHALGENENTVSVRIHRGLKKMKDLLTS